MAARRCDFLLLLLAVALAGRAVVGQAAPPNSFPDFSGVWAHPFLTGFEPPASGPGPVLNLSRRPNGVANFGKLVGDYRNPILKPQAAEIVKKHGEISLAGLGYPTPSNQCWPGGVPYVFWDFLMEMFQAPDHITMIYRHGNEVRRVRMNEQHPVKLSPSWYGDSVGHYEGDALVIDTVGVKHGPFAMQDMYGTPFSDKLHVIERYRLLDYEQAKDAIERNRKENFQASGGGDFDPNYRGKVLQLHFTVEDAGVFTTPWTSTITYRPALGPFIELICAENRREYYAGRDSDIPHTDTPDF
ncbi:MAG TPA: hypothetical protein VH684_28025 [Xanthobacteraceae bacterium]|jgi:hypothetical protein